MANAGKNRMRVKCAPRAVGGPCAMNFASARDVNG
jgi:hypothetical protein